MSLVQYIYNTTNRDDLTVRKGILISLKSVEICERLNMTGRVFSSQYQALSIMEGPAEVMRQYVEAVETLPHVQTVLVHSVRDIETREFDDYSVWLDIDEPFRPNPKVHPMTSDSLSRAMPATPSPRLRVMVDAFFKQGRLVV